MTFVSKNGLSFIGLLAIKFEIGRERPLHLAELLDRPIFGPVTGHSEVAFTCNRNLDFVSLFEVECFHNRRGKAHSQTVTPLGNLHEDIPSLLYIHVNFSRNPGGPSSQWANPEIAVHPIRSKPQYGGNQPS